MSKWNTDICKGIESEMTAEELWKKSGLAGTYEAWPFGGAPDKLADLVLQRIKTATCSAYDLYQIENEPLPQAGDYSVILNSNDQAVCIIKTLKVYVTEFKQVSEEHAFKEGEGDRSLEYWRKVHERFLINELANVTEAELEARGTIHTAFGENLSWNYLCYVRSHPIRWTVPTQILYGSRDDLTSIETIRNFAKNHHAILTIMEGGEHWFHTEKQMRFLDDWIMKESHQ